MNCNIKHPWRVYVRPVGYMLTGVLLILTTGVIAERSALPEALLLDYSGDTAIGEAELQSDGTYRIRYTTSDGGIYARTRIKTLGSQSTATDDNTITIRFNPRNPAQFQPEGLSYLPAGFAFLTFFTGMALLLRGRRDLLTKLKRHQAEASGVNPVT